MHCKSCRENLSKFKKFIALCIVAVLISGMVSGCTSSGHTSKDDSGNNETQKSDYSIEQDNSVSAEKNNVTEKGSQTAVTNSNQTATNRNLKSGTLVNPLNLSDNAGQKQSKSSVKFQSLSSFVDNQMDVHETKQRDLELYQKFTGDEEDAKIIAEYANLLCQSGMNFKKADSYYMEYDRETFASWGFNYIGTASVKEPCEITFVDEDQTCAIAIYYTTKYGSVEGYINWSASLEAEDLGFRTGGRTESTAPAGKSVGAGLIRTADGKYQTTDGRFSVGLNQASIIINNAKQSGTLTYEDTKYSDSLKIKNADGIDIFRIFFSNSVPLKTGIIYDSEDLATNYQWSSDSGPVSMSIEATRVYQYVNKKWLTPTHTDSPYEDITFRVVYYNATEQVAVFYLYTNILHEAEMFCAVDLSTAVKPDQGSSGSLGSSGSSSDGYIPNANSNSSKCRYCGGKGYTTCTSCNGKGYYVIRGSTPDYAGSGGSKNYTEIKDCPSVHCRDGIKDCPHCNTFY